jgi:hypothetical protein
MLAEANLNPTTDAAIQRYLHDTLGLPVHLRPWPGAENLPYFLQDAFHTRELQLHGHTVLIAQDLRPLAPKLADLRTQLDKLRTAAQLPVIYVTNALASYERKRLVAQRVPFLVPGNQLYLPDLGIDLREYFRHPNTPTGEALSPATQAVLISMLLTKPWRDDWSLAEIVTRLGYTPMTLTRVVRELTAAGLAKVKRHGHERHLQTDELPQQLWDRAQQQMRSPVKRSVWVQTTTHVVPHMRLAGLSALARLTQLADPPWPIYAIGPTAWRDAKQGGIKYLMEPSIDCSEWQIWSYSPELSPDPRTVDPLSLTLSLEHSADERVQMARDHLRRHLPW